MEAQWRNKFTFSAGKQNLKLKAEIKDIVPRCYLAPVVKQKGKDVPSKNKGFHMSKAQQGASTDRETQEGLTSTELPSYN